MAYLKGWLTSLLFSLLVAHQLLASADGQCNLDNTVPSNQPGNNAIPYIFNITDLSYTLTVEANLQEKKRTVYGTEFYDQVNANGRVDMLFDGKVTQFLYFNDTAETFTTSAADQTCKTGNLNSALETPYDQFKVYQWKDAGTPQPILGPSNLLRYGYKSHLANRVGKEKDTVTVRGIKTNVWRQCDNNNQLTVRYFFIDPATENGFGVKGKQVPARVTVSGTTDEGNAINHVYDFVNYQIFVPDIGNVFKIPKMMGCIRTAPDMKKVPSYEKKDFHLEAEVVYTPWGNSNYSYVSTIAITMDNPSQHFAYELTTWKTHEDAEMAEPGDDIKFIYDIRNEYKYIIDETQGSCFVDDESYSPVLKLPDGQELSLFSTDLFVRDNRTVNEYHYLGDDTERGIPVSVFEKKLQDDVEGDFDDVIITKYHLADDTFLNTEYSERNAPVKVVYSNMNINEKFFGILVFNIYAFTSKVKNKREKFDVTNCFAKNDQSKWIQMIFPMRDNKPEDVIPLTNYIEDNFLSLLSSPLMISPLRMPQIMVDVDSDNIYVTALVLERPDFTLDFQSQGRYGLSRNNIPVGITTQSKCAKACLERTTCNYFSYCGVICILADEEPGPKEEISDSSCELFRHNKFSSALSTMDEISARIAGLVDLGAVQLTLPGGPKEVMQFLATGFKDGIAFGLNGINSRREDNIDERLNTVYYGKKFDETVSDVVKPLGVQSFATCRRACLNNPDCESLSFCQATSECAMSSLHASAIESTHTKDDWQCVIMSRVYADYFDRYPGFVLVQTAKKRVPEANTEDLCAKACLDEKEFKCLSFDFCPYPNDPKDKCLLHTDHFINFSKDETPNVNKTSEECGHFSKKFVYDFEEDLGNQINADMGVPIKDVNVEECAKYCLEDSKINCQTFDFCMTGSATEPERTCRLFSQTKSQLTKKTAPKCKIYQRSGTKTTLLSPSWKAPISKQRSKRAFRGRRL